MKIKKNPRNCRQQKSGSWAFFRFFSARRRHLSWVYLFQEISLYRAYGQEDTTKRIVMNLKAMLLTGLFILLKYTVSSSQRLVLSNCSYLTLTFLACQEVFLFFWFLFLIIFLNFLFIFGERHQGTGLDQESVLRLIPFLLGCRLKSINCTL